MRNMKTMLSLLLCAALLLGMAGCGTPAPAETVPTTTPPTTQAPTEPPVSDLYTQAAQPLRDANNLAVELTVKKTFTADAGSFTQISEQELILTGIGTEVFAAKLSEELEIGEYNDEFTEYYENGTLYVNIYDIGYFQGEMTQADFLSRFAPAVLLDETLYSDITASETDSGMTLTFAGPVGPENWALPDGAEFVDAGGTAKISAGGELTKTTYTLSYIQGSFAVSVEITAEAELYDETAPAAPEDPSAYIKVDSIDALRLYDTAILYIVGAQTGSSTLSQTIVSQAAGCTMAEETELHYTGTGKDLLADIGYTVTFASSTQGNEIYSQTERFENGIYTYAPEGAAAETSTDITPEDMSQYIQGHYGDNLPALDYITTASSEDVGGLLYLEMGLSEQWGEDTNHYVSYMLFEDEGFLDSYASAYKTTESSYYMVVDPATGFPVSAGTTYSGVHTIDGVDYVLSLEIGQTYRLTDSATYEELTGELLPEEAPETPATPLLYRVTGEQGQEMYLMGTIHAGDERTAYLPDAVYEALNSADALAVEADIIAFEEQMETDPELSAKVAMLFLNTGAPTAREQWDPAVYEQAVKLLKASGEYNSGMEYASPYLWSSAIESFYMTLGSIRTEKGVDMRLLKLAKEQGKEIREVESGMYQMEMFAGFSYELQSMLLQQTLGCTAAEYCDDVEKLYALWCAGDEAALREEMSGTPAELTEEELALYQEYVDAVIIQRNARMLDVAVSYLEGGDTVFYAVGMAHLLQENGLVDTLRDAGYTVEQVQYP